MSSELLKIIESHQETIATLTRLLELELKDRKNHIVLPDPFKPNFELFKYGEMLKPSCAMQDIPPPTTERRYSSQYKENTNESK